MVTTAPLVQPPLAGTALSTAKSRLQLRAYQPRQNQDRSSPPALSIARKKSDGEGCLNDQSAMYLRKAQSKRSGPNICSRSSTIPSADLK